MDPIDTNVYENYAFQGDGSEYANGQNTVKILCQCLVVFGNAKQRGGEGEGGALMWTDLTEYRTPAIFIRTVSTVIFLPCVVFTNLEKNVCRMQPCILLLQYLLLCQRTVLDFMMSVLKPRPQNTDNDEQRLSQTPASLTESKENVFSNFQLQSQNKRKTSNDSSCRTLRSLFRLASGSLGFH